jgi:UDP-N-acetylmuramoyl-L-alanyl-D-glutamate--2,6-diaminopimelate ligase
VRVDAAHTTPEADELARIIKDMRDRGATHVAMEVSSIALVTRRVHAVRFRVAAFTNLTQDHLDFHGTMDAYAAAKAELFTTALPGSAVLHVGDPFGRALASRVKAPTVRVSAVVDASPSEADVAPTALSMSSAGIRCTLRVPGGSVELVSPLFGQHNVENIVVALGVIVALGLDARRAAAALAEEAGAPGRLERCDGPNDDVTVLVDYAHTPDAVSRVLATVRNVVQGRLIAVLGCGGDRDPTKRGPMGTAAARGADIAVITNDNPRGEVPDDIAKAIEVGLSEGGMEKVRLESIRDVRRGFAVELDRSRAIHAAVLSAAPGDTVVVLGKGHEAYQIIGERRSVFDDRVEARAALTLRHAQRSGETAR